MNHLLRCTAATAKTHLPMKQPKWAIPNATNAAGSMQCATCGNWQTPYLPACWTCCHHAELVVEQEYGYYGPSGIVVECKECGKEIDASELESKYRITKIEQ